MFNRRHNLQLLLLAGTALWLIPGSFQNQSQRGLTVLNDLTSYNVFVPRSNEDFHWMGLLLRNHRPICYVSFVKAKQLWTITAGSCISKRYQRRTGMFHVRFGSYRWLDNRKEYRVSKLTWSSKNKFLMMRLIGDKDMERGLEVANDAKNDDKYQFMTFNNYGYPDAATSVQQYKVLKQKDNNLCAPGAHNSESFCGKVSDGPGNEDPYLPCNAGLGTGLVDLSCKYLIGVVTRSNKCLSTTDEPDTNTYVSKYKPWIERSIQH
uniref:Salivary serine protease n=1 Tax=Simulium nigrimanum TaxID=683695 RepID=D1FQ05_SIMNI